MAVDSPRRPVPSHARVILNKGAHLLLLLAVVLNGFVPSATRAAHAAAATAKAPASPTVAWQSGYQPPRLTRPIPRRGVRPGEIAITLPRSENQDVPCPTSGDLLVASGETCYLEAGSYRFDRIVVQSQGLLLLKGDEASGEGVTLNADSMTIESGGAVSADGFGYGPDRGPGHGGAGMAEDHQGGGGGHGGIGGKGYGLENGGPSYGDVLLPLTLGSGGGSNHDAFGGRGGGAIRLIVNGELILNGTISANGGAGQTNWESGYAGGGGAGGSIWITAAALSGSGKVQASGGRGGYWWSGPEEYSYGQYGGGGAGGRIHIDVVASADTFQGAVEAHAAQAGYCNWTGGAGTIYWSAASRLVVDNGNEKAGAPTPLAADTFAFAQVEIRGRAILRLQGEEATVNLAQTVLHGDGSGRLEVEGVLRVPADYVFSEVMVVVLNDLVGVEDLVLRGSGGLELHAGALAHPGGEYTFNSITVGSGATLRLASWDDGDEEYTDDYGVTLRVNKVTVENGGAISADGLGYGPGRGPGRGGEGGYKQGGGGGGHGGRGGNGQDASNGGQAYDDVTAPLTLGSGGGGVGVFDLSGRSASGGGAMRLIVSDLLRVDGKITANGEGDGWIVSEGAGAGGSIWITAGLLQGTGSVTANGGGSNIGNYYNGEHFIDVASGAGAGGRVRIDVSPNHSTFEGQVQARGGYGYYTSALLG
jgi:hypothetical protein